jgi:ubiquinone/menaquinone biosynthesis C-methylase UbiE
LLTALNRARPRVLDLGAGSGRFGWPFVAAGDDYIGADLSAGMLRSFAGRYAGNRPPALVQADGRTLPFPTACFDLVLLIAVFGDLPDWRPLVDEACRVLRAGGMIAIGRIEMPDDGIDACMKQQLDTILEQMTTAQPRKNGRQRAAQYLAAAASATTETVVASWVAQRSPRQFLERHAGGARFSRIPHAIRDHALPDLAHWALTQFGSLDTPFSETHRFEMQLFEFQER